MSAKEKPELFCEILNSEFRNRSGLIFIKIKFLVQKGFTNLNNSMYKKCLRF